MLNTGFKAYICNSHHIISGVPHKKKTPFPWGLENVEAPLKSLRHKSAGELTPLNVYTASREIIST